MISNLFSKCNRSREIGDANFLRFYKSCDHRDRASNGFTSRADANPYKVFGSFRSRDGAETKVQRQGEESEGCDARLAVSAVL
jgi:hypothetical protein